MRDEALPSHLAPIACILLQHQHKATPAQQSNPTPKPQSRHNPALQRKPNPPAELGIHTQITPQPSTPTTTIAPTRKWPTPPKSPSPAPPQPPQTRIAHRNHGDIRLRPEGHLAPSPPHCARFPSISRCRFWCRQHSLHCPGNVAPLLPVKARANGNNRLRATTSDMATLRTCWRPSRS